jgi:hypothetical protein
VFDVQTTPENRRSIERQKWRRMKIVKMASAHQVFKDRCVPWKSSEFPPHWSFQRRRDRNPEDMTPERAQQLLRGNSALVLPIE